MVFTGGCRTYRKTLVERGKHTATPVKKRKQERSRKQRVNIKSYGHTYILVIVYCYLHRVMSVEERW